MLGMHSMTMVYEAVGELVLDYVEGDLDQDFSDLDLMDLVTHLRISSFNTVEKFLNNMAGR